MLAHFHEGDAGHVTQAIDAALAARPAWAALAWEQRAAIFLKAADLLAGPLPRPPERGHHAGPEQERVPGRD
ncbi:MAG: aldehyde dehydrogenase family protein [Hymenobacter sp.]